MAKIFVEQYKKRVKLIVMPENAEEKGQIRSLKGMVEGLRSDPRDDTFVAEYWLNEELRKGKDHEIDVGAL